MNVCVEKQCDENEGCAEEYECVQNECQKKESCFYNCVVEEDGLRIRFDYRFDSKKKFNNEATRAALEAAATIWEDVILDNFADIPANTVLFSRNPENPREKGSYLTVETPIDGVLIFPGFANLKNDDGDALGEAFPSATITMTGELSGYLGERYDGSDFEPWTGWVSFDETNEWYFDETPDTADDIPPATPDFISVAVHEIGHILGIGTSDAFKNLIDEDGYFTGEEAMKVYGGRVPLQDSRNGIPTHIAKSVTIDGETPIMSGGGHGDGKRYHVTALDLAILKDIGYRIKDK